MERLRVLQVTAGARGFALDVTQIRSIERPARWARLPWAPDYVRGVSEVRGLVVVVIDLAARLGLPPGLLQATQGVVVIDSAEPVGLAVEAIGDVVPIAPDGLRELGPAGRRAGIQGIDVSGLVLLDGEPLVDGRDLAPIDSVLTTPATPKEAT